MKGTSRTSGRNLATLVVLSFFLGGCSLLFGNVKPIDERSNAYDILDLSKENHDWKRLDTVLRNESPNSNGESKESLESGLSDIAYQSQNTASVISMNSACKSYGNTELQKPLKELTRELLLGFSEVTQDEERSITIDQTPALQTTLRGKLNQETVMIRTVVLQRGPCVYDLMYVSRPENFKTHEMAFSRFVDSLRLTEKHR